MRKTFSLFAFVLLVLPGIGASATDFVAKKLEMLQLTAGVYQWALLVRNDNVLADAFAVRLEIFLGTTASGQKVYDETQEEPTLNANSERTVTGTTTFSPPTSGEYFARASVLYESEIDPSDNIIDLIFTALRPECKVNEAWRRGPAMTVDMPFKVWPDSAMLMNMMRPADAIGIAVAVSDMDFLEQKCNCVEDTSVLRGPYPDGVGYEWTLEGPGTLIASPSGGKNTVMYQLPVCAPSFFSATVRLRVTNNGGKAADEELAGSVTFNVSTARIYSADFTPTWQPYTYDVAVIYNHLQPKSDEVIETLTGVACKPQPIEWTKESPITPVGGILKQHAQHLCPEYITLLSVAANDVDKYKLKCQGTAETCSPDDTSSNSSADGLTYTWSIIGGAGEFPVTNLGPSVVVRRSANHQTIVQCIINDGGAQADDDPVTLIDTLPPVGKPKAFVGLGDDEGTSVSKLAGSVWDYWKEAFGGTVSTEDTYGGRSGALHSAYETMVTRLTDAGYEVIGDDSLLVTEFEAAVSDPCIKAFAFVGHGAGGHINMARMNLGGWNTPTRAADHVRSITNSTFNCDKQPFWRDLVMLACETMRGSWGDIQLYGRAHGYTTTKTFAMLRAWAFWSYSPFPPIVFTVD